MVAVALARTVHIYGLSEAWVLYLVQLSLFDESFYSFKLYIPYRPTVCWVGVEGFDNSMIS